MVKSKDRGHDIVFVGREWLYKDTMTPTYDNPRSCWYCGEKNTSEDHDACVGTLAGVINACCGHGNTEDAYVQFPGGRCIGGENALAFIRMSGRMR